MKFYNEIAHCYDNIFPLSNETVNFTVSFLREEMHDVLDIGCATGKLALALSAHGYRITGIDLDEEMIGAAANEARAKKLDARFFVADMCELDAHFDAGAFDAALCFGNTVVHLQNPVEIGKFFNGIFRLLRAGGVFIFQILNYDRILRLRVRDLPLIDNEVLRFTRWYEYSSTDPRLLFCTELLIKETQGIKRNGIPLYPAQSHEIAEFLNGSGFKGFNFFSDYQRNPYTPEGYALIAAAYK
jgi:SAM-dependent methyltransferase